MGSTSQNYIEPVTSILSLVSLKLNKQKRKQRYTSKRRKVKVSSWNSKKLDLDKFWSPYDVDGLKYTYIRSTRTPDNIVRTIKMAYIRNLQWIAMCSYRGKVVKKLGYWWTEETAELRRNCLVARRRSTKSKSDAALLFGVQ